MGSRRDCWRSKWRRSHSRTQWNGRWKLHEDADGEGKQYVAARKETPITVVRKCRAGWKPVPAEATRRITDWAFHPAASSFWAVIKAAEIPLRNDARKFGYHCKKLNSMMTTVRSSRMAAGSAKGRESRAGARRRCGQRRRLGADARERDDVRLRLAGGRVMLRARARW